ncbi:MAG: DMT family transporter [Bacteroidetes bacterium]|nr:DMT family transporter [Bacteroidota bacterium]
MWKVHAALITVGLIYGANYSIAKWVMPNFIEANGFILLRILGAFLFITVLQQTRIREKITDKGDLLRLLLCAIFGVAGNMLFFFNGLKLTSPINASVIMTINPLLVLLFSTMLLKERVTWLKVAGITIGMIGAVMQIIDPFNVGKKVESVNWLGDLFVMVNASFYAVYLVLVKPLMAKYHPLTVVRYTFSIGLIMVLPFGFSDLVKVQWHSITPEIASSLLFVVVGTTIMAYLLNAWALKHVNSTTVGAYIYLQPLFAAVIAIGLANYKATWHMLVYALLIFIGVFMVNFANGGKKGVLNG